jgi:hypothetical protein
VIDFRDMVRPLLRKPGAFGNYQHREAMYPSVGYRGAYDRLVADHGQRSGVIEYLRLLQLAMDQGLQKVEEALEPWMAGSQKWRATQVAEALGASSVSAPPISEFCPELVSYDGLLAVETGEEVSHVG